MSENIKIKAYYTDGTEEDVKDVTEIREALAKIEKRLKNKIRKIDVYAIQVHAVEVVQQSPEGRP